MIIQLGKGAAKEVITFNYSSNIVLDRFSNAANSKRSVGFIFNEYLFLVIQAINLEN